MNTNPIVDGDKIIFVVGPGEGTAGQATAVYSRDGGTTWYTKPLPLSLFPTGEVHNEFIKRTTDSYLCAANVGMAHLDNWFMDPD